MFRCSDTNPSMLYAKRFGIRISVPTEGWESPSRLSQVADNGLHLGLQEGASLGIVVHGGQLGKQERATLYPSVEGLLCGCWTAAWLVEQSQFGLAIGADLEHVFRDFGWLDDGCRVFSGMCKDTKYLPLMQLFTVLFYFYQDISGHCRT